MTICDKFQLDPRCAADVESGNIPRGCISCQHCPSIGPCRATGRGRDLPDGSYLSLSGRIYRDDPNDESSDEE